MWVVSRRQLFVFAALATASGVGAAPTPRPFMKVYKDPNCGCCNAWVEKMELAHFDTQVQVTNDLTEIKARLGVPNDLTSCHTATVGHYVFEGHVPAADIVRVLTARLAIIGLAVPGMPVNSPGMEVPGMAGEPYTVWQFTRDGKRKPFAIHKPA